MNTIEIRPTVVDRHPPAPERLRSGLHQAMPDPVIGGRAVVQGALDIAGRLAGIPDDLSQRIKAAGLLDETHLSNDRTRQTYLDLAERGRASLTSLRVSPALAHVLNGLHTASNRADQRVQHLTDEIHDRGEELLGWANLTATAATRWLVWPTPSRTRALLRLISRRPTPRDLSPAPAISPHDRVAVEQATGVLAQHGQVGMNTAFDRMLRHAHDDPHRLIALARQIVARDADLDTVLGTPTTTAPARPT